MCRLDAASEFSATVASSLFLDGLGASVPAGVRGADVPTIGDDSVLKLTFGDARLVAVAYDSLTGGTLEDATDGLVPGQAVAALVVAGAQCM